jgi:hypothetical protein
MDRKRVVGISRERYGPFEDGIDQQDMDIG